MTSPDFDLLDQFLIFLSFVFFNFFIAMKYFTEFGNELISKYVLSICFCLSILQSFLQILLASLYSTDFEPNCLRISRFCVSELEVQVLSSPFQYLWVFYLIHFLMLHLIVFYCTLVSVEYGMIRQ